MTSNSQQSATIIDLPVNLNLDGRKLRRAARAQNAALQDAKSQLDQIRRERDALQRDLTALSHQVHTQAASFRLEAAHRLAHEQALHRATTEEAQAAYARLEQIGANLHAERESLQREYAAARNRLTAVETELRAARERLDLAHERNRTATAQINALIQRVSTESDAKQAVVEQARKTQEDLERSNLKYRQAVTEEIPKLKTKLEEQSALTRTLQHELEQARLAQAKARRDLSQAERTKQRLEREKCTTQAQVQKVRASLSFQLGYLLIHSFKSVRGMLGLPSGLWAFRKEVKRRRQRKEPVAAPAMHIAPSPGPITPPLPVPVDHVPKNLARLRMACIMDEFTYGAFSPECNALQLTPANWQAELEEFQPEILFIESAWRGKDALWDNKVGHVSMEVQGIVAWCRARGIPTAFWNKEDPVHFTTFLNTARLFDHVFTTDIDCIHRYKALLGHDKVYLMPFACQPSKDNPIEVYERKDAFCFAGAYYARYPERTRDLETMVDELPSFRPVEIYDRNHGKNDPNYQFPHEFQQHIVGTLPFEQIDKAYKGYHYAINLNSIKQSQTMFARRVFELLASNTLTVSNFSRGIRLLFGDLVIATDSGKEMVRQISAAANDPVRGRKLRLAALRKVMLEHTYGHRLAYAATRIGLPAQAPVLPRIAVLAHAANASDLDLLLGHYRCQRHADKTLIVVLQTECPCLELEPGITILSEDQARGQTIGLLASGNDLVAGMVAQDYYGPNYLLDLALATRYSDADAFGKAAHVALKAPDGALELLQEDAAYRPANLLSARSTAVRLARVAENDAVSWLESLPYLELEIGNGLALDEFNYCRNGAIPECRAAVTARVDDLDGLDCGITFDTLLSRAAHIPPEILARDPKTMISGARLAGDFGRSSSTALKTIVENSHWQVASTLPENKHEYLHATLDHGLSELGADSRFRFYLEASPGLNLQLVLFFLDAQKQKIGHVIRQANCNQEVELPAATERIRFALRIHGPGNTEIKSLLLGHRSLQPADLVGRAQHLVLTNHYPAYDDLYRNGFVHTRIRAYAEQGLKCDVFRLRQGQSVTYHEFEGIDVTTGSQEALEQLLASGQYKSVLVHFLDPAMWEVLQRHIDRIRVVVWVHGAEIQPWWRRDYNYRTEAERAKAMISSEQRMAFWRGLLQPMPANLNLVFVSRYFAEEVMEDLGMRIPDERYSIIHNPIASELFTYRRKRPDQRLKVLSIRPYASAKYANDLSVKAIQILADRPWFADMEFRLIGDGPLFEEILAPLRIFRNVYIEQRFLTQAEIADLHKEYGIFLCPTRMDAQGVSRDEAMSSGLVPITNNVAAIPEFVDPTCGVLAPPEDAESMAQGIAMLVENPERFAALSEAAAQRVIRQSDSRIIIQREMALIL